MTTMTGEAAKKIAESTIKKYNNANRNAMIVFFKNDDLTSVSLYSNMSLDNIIAVALGVVNNLTEEQAEDVFKDAAKQAKQLRKEETKKEKKHGSKH